MDGVIVTADSADVLEGLFACRPLVEAFERLIVVDNASTDRSARITEKAGAVLVSFTNRVGYGSAVNAGAQATSGACFGVLNPDIRFFDPRTVRNLELAMEDPAVALVAPALELPDGRTQDSARQVPTPFDLVLRRRLRRERGAIWHGGDVPWVVGACFVVRRAAYDAVEGFDERYFLYFEDIDLCVRLRREGWKVRFDPSVRVLHHHQAESRQSLTSWSTRTHIRSAARFYRANPKYLVLRS